MGASNGLNDVKIRYGNVSRQPRPFFINARSWEAFDRYVWGGLSLSEIAAGMDTSLRNIRQMIADVDQRLSLPRSGGREWSELTRDSPVEDLQLSVRARNRLRDLGCATVDDVVRLNMDSARIGKGSREEVEQVLKRHGLLNGSASSAHRVGEVERLTAQVQDLRERIDEHVRTWRARIDGLEARLKRIAQRAE